MTYSRLRILVAALAVALITVAPAVSAPSAPNPLFPNGDTFDGAPAMGWDKVSGADHYEVEIGADAGFNPDLYFFTTDNTRATISEALASGDYWWHVRAVDANDNVSPWSPAQSFVVDWSQQPDLLQPADGATVDFPDTPLVLKWSSVPRAQKYKLELATSPTGFSDPDHKVSSNYPLETQALEFTVPEALEDGEPYYWRVTPIDARNHLGSQSEVHSFVWAWPHQPENLTVTDLDPDADDQHFDPLFSWDPVPGAASYQVEVRSADATGTLAFSGTTIATSVAPNDVFPDNAYDWTVRAVDAAGNGGAVSDGPQFDRAFDKHPLAIENLRMTDYLTGNAAVDQDSGTPGFQTQVPLVTWDPVPGAASYEIQVAPFSASCNFNDPVWEDVTATTAWAPLGKTGEGEPYNSTVGVAKSNDALTLNASYCVRVLARSGHKGSTSFVRGAYTLLNDGTGAAFQWTGYPSTVPCSPSCVPGYAGSDNYKLPDPDAPATRMPFFSWEPIDGAQSYWVIVYKDETLGTMVDYAFTQLPVYTPRTGDGSAVRTYDDENGLYWVILPSSSFDGDAAAFDPYQAPVASFDKQSTPPTLLEPAAGATVTDQPVFTWTPVDGAKLYRIQIATDSNFSSADMLMDTTTAATSYSAETTYPADTAIWWRVQAVDEGNHSMRRSTPQSFEKALLTPDVSVPNPTAGDLIPTFGWDLVQGASSYDVHFELPDGTGGKDGTNYAPTSVTAIKMTGAGHFRWQVRANYPGGVHGPYTSLMDFTRTIHEPQNLASTSGPSQLLLSWDPKTAAKQYVVQIAKNTSFSSIIDPLTTDNTSYAPKLTSSSYTSGGTFYWRVRAKDADGNQGDWSPVKDFDFAGTTSGGTGGTSKFKLSSSGRLVKKHLTKVTITAKNASTLNPVFAATVKASGAGVSTTKFTTTSGVAIFYLKPTKLGKVTFKVTKSGYQTAYLYKKVRRP